MNIEAEIKERLIEELIYLSNSTQVVFKRSEIKDHGTAIEVLSKKGIDELHLLVEVGRDQLERLKIMKDPGTPVLTLDLARFVV